MLKRYISVFFLFWALFLSACSESQSNQEGFLEYHESQGGHTIERHVGLSDRELKARFERGNIQEASTFETLELAEEIIFKALISHEKEIIHWLKNEKDRDRLVIQIKSQKPVGWGLRRGEEESTPRYGARVVLQRKNGDMFILTAYPQHRRPSQ